MDIQYRVITDPDDIEAAVDLQGAIWSSSDRDAIPSHMLRALQHTGGLLLGAFDSQTLVGMVLSFPATVGGQHMHWSHIAGVLPSYQGRGIGRQLKIHQREWALAQGYSYIGWTFDPLQSANAYFNIARLGCTCNIYHVDFYGNLADGLNTGLPTDRFEVHWWLKGSRTERYLKANRESEPIPDCRPVLLSGTNNLPEYGEWPLDSTETRVEIPIDINRLREQHPDIALQWRLKTREAFRLLFELNFTVVDVIRSRQDGETRCWYILHKQPKHL